MKAEQFLRNGADVLAERGKEYDKPEGERSMQRCVSAFEIITGKRITEAEGWLFMQILKDVRQWQKPDRYHEDSAVDCVNYAALKAEALSEQESEYPSIHKVNELVAMERAHCDVIGKPDWKDAPEWAYVLVRSKEDGQYEWAESFEQSASLTCKLEDSGDFRFAHDFAHFWTFVEPRP